MTTRKAKSKKAQKTAKKKPVARKKAGAVKAAKPAKKKRTVAKAAPARAGATPKRAAPKAAKKKVATRGVAKKAAKKKTSRARARRKGPLKKWMPFREALVQRQRELTQAYHASKGDSRNRLDDGTEDYIDYAVSSYAREFLLSLTELDRKQLMLVDEAIRRIDTGGDYGQCLNCAQEIAPKRLQVAPWARYCVRCQELDDQGLLEEPGNLMAGDEDDDEDYDAIDYDDADYDEELDEDDEDEESDPGEGSLVDDEDD